MLSFPLSSMFRAVGLEMAGASRRHPTLSMRSLPTGIVLGKRYREAIQWDIRFLSKHTRANCRQAPARPWPWVLSLRHDFETTAMPHNQGARDWCFRYSDGLALVDGPAKEYPSAS
jgi:hypothetical protein